MYISKLELFGFKSFANKTVLHFDKGITGIVGPNGCGKTNTVDAIRWVLGEQKSSTLRSDKMESVIFNGTKTKKPLGMSEASITFINDDNTLPTDYSEVTITRRIFRSGESEYLLNKNVCRLKDITNLFMDTGMATNAYSVIELKMIEGILNDKTGERRKMFEEAAGVNKYKHRRKISLKKLDEVKADLIRVNDIVSEVQKQVTALERQAKKADKFNVLQTELREKELDYSERRFTILISKIESLSNEISTLKTTREETDKQIREIEVQLISIRDEIIDIEKNLRIKQQEIGKLNERLHEVQKDISVSNEREKSLHQNIDRFKNEVEELKFQEEEHQLSIEAYYEQIVSLEQDIGTNRAELENKSDEIKNQKEILLQKQISVKEKEDFLKDLEISFNQKKNEIDSIIKNIESANKRVEQLNLKIQNWTNDIAKTVGFIDELNNDKSSTEQLLAENEKEYFEQRQVKEKLGAEIQELFEKETSEKSNLSALEDKIDFIKSLIDNLEGVSKGSKILIENKEWSDKEKTIFADVGKTDDKYRYALEAALKKVLNNLLIDDSKSLNDAINYLKKNDLGKASFFLLNKIENSSSSLSRKIENYFHKRKIKKLSKENSFVDWTINNVQTDGKWLPYFEKILSKTAIVKDISSAINLTNQYPEFTFVTLEGDLIQKDGIIEAGSLPKLDDTIFGRKQLIEDLKNELNSRRTDLEKLQNFKSELQFKFDAIDLDKLGEKGKRISSEITNIEKQISKMESEQNKFTEQIENSQSEIHSELNDVKIYEISLEQNRIESNSLETKIEEEKNVLTQLEQDFKEFENEYNSKLKEINEKTLFLEKTKGSLKNEQNKIESLRTNLRKIEETIKKRIENIEQSETEILQISEMISERTFELDELTGERNVLYDSKREIDDKLQEVKQKQNGFESQLSQLRNNRTFASDKIHTLDIDLNKFSFEHESLVTHIQEEYSIELVKKDFDDLDNFNFNEAKREVSILKEKIKNLGPINTLAYSEYEEQKERLDFLLQQRTDLIDSEKDLINTINEINDTAQLKFVETFENIRENFKINFRTLFDPGDEADLVMEENEDPLEAKINIIAKPKGKRPTTIDLLSQGEKTLTATALLFAFYLVKPSPFCILDEVDAPLDDANVDRFTKLIRKFSEKTQFIIVTHNKRTMIFADAIYGVTMVEDGVSKLAGIKFDEKLGVN